MSQPERHYQLHHSARFRVLDDAGVFVLQESGEVLEINAVGACIVQALQETGSALDAAKRLVEHFDVDEATAERDTLEFIDQLVDVEALSVRTVGST